MWLQNIIHYPVFGVPLWVILLCGVLGVLVDIDHPIAHYLIPEWSGRFLHAPLLIISGVVLCGCCAYCAGLYIRLVLGGKG